MYFNRTLNDWVKFNINNRTKYDAAISSGLAAMACNRNLYKPTEDRTTKKMDLGINTIFKVSSDTSDKTITFPNATDTLVGKATTDVLTNKTLTDPVIQGTIAKKIS